jgi:dTDP-4-dehydrorhamnose reductase
MGFTITVIQAPFRGMILRQKFLNSLARKLRLKPIKTKDYPTAAKRPKYSVLDTTKIKNNFMIVQ